MSSAREKGERESCESNIKGVYFDGRKDQTKVIEYDHLTKRYHKRCIKENHITLTSEPDGQYRHHFTPVHSDKMSNKPAREVAQEVFNWKVKHGVDKTVLVLGGDSTNEMSGWSGGAIAWLEKMLGRKTFWVICNLHTNGLPLRHLIHNINGKSSSKDGFAGPELSPD